MKQETQRKVENFIHGMQVTLEALDDLKSDRFYAQKIKYHGNLLMKEIERLFSDSFKVNTQEAVDYYIGLNDWLKIASSTYSQYSTLTEENKVRYLAGLSNFNTINLKNK